MTAAEIKTTTDEAFQQEYGIAEKTTVPIKLNIHALYDSGSNAGVGRAGGGGGGGGLKVDGKAFWEWGNTESRRWNQSFQWVKNNIKF